MGIQVYFELFMTAEPNVIDFGEQILSDLNILQGIRDQQCIDHQALTGRWGFKYTLNSPSQQNQMLLTLVNEF
jgi:hypothetical protein